MKKVPFFAMLIGLIAVAACVPSIHGLCTPETEVFKPELLGCWFNQDDGEGWRFTRDKNNGYRVAFFEKDGNRLNFVGRLAAVEKRLFLDLYPDGESLHNDCFAIPAHIFLLVRQIEPELRLAVMNPDEMKKIVAGDPGAVKHECVKDGIVLTAQAPELQKFLAGQAKEGTLFRDLRPVKRWEPVEKDESVLKRMERDCLAAPEVRKAIGVELSVVGSYFRRSITSTKTPYGFRMAKVAAGTPAARAGWKAGDILLTWGGNKVESVATLLEWIGAAEPGVDLPVEISRLKSDVPLFSRTPWKTIETAIIIK
jgi:hypothetical protein